VHCYSVIFSEKGYSAPFPKVDVTNVPGCSRCDVNTHATKRSAGRALPSLSSGVICSVRRCPSPLYSLWRCGVMIRSGTWGLGGALIPLLTWVSWSHFQFRTCTADSVASAPARRPHNWGVHGRLPATRSDAELSATSADPTLASERCCMLRRLQADSRAVPPTRNPVTDEHTDWIT
jgi:hypothetical protein